jgi:hypothetical protein
MSKRITKVINCENSTERNRVQETLDRLGFSYSIDRLNGERYCVTVYADNGATPKEADPANEIKAVHVTGNLLGMSATVHITLQDGRVITREGSNRSKVQQELEKAIGDIRAKVSPSGLYSSPGIGSWLR